MPALLKPFTPIAAPAANIVILWLSLSSLLQCCVAFRNRRILQRSISYNDFRQHCLARSRGSLLRLLSWSSLLALPPFQDIIHSLQAPRRFWAATAGLLREGRVSVVAKHGESVPWLGTELLPAAFQNVKGYILVPLSNLWQVF